MRQEALLCEILANDGNLCVVKAVVDGKDTQICFPKTCGVEKYIGEKIYFEKKNKLIYISCVPQSIMQTDILVGHDRKGEV